MRTMPTQPLTSAQVATIKETGFYVTSGLVCGAIGFALSILAILLSLHWVEPSYGGGSDPGLRALAIGAVFLLIGAMLLGNAVKHRITTAHTTRPE